MYKLSEIMERAEQLAPNQPQFHQAVEDVFHSVVPYINEQEKYQNHALLEQLLVPDRIIEFRVTWQDSEDNMQVNRGWRVQHNNALGAYKGGLRFHPSVDLDTFKFLAFEQTFKNALTGLPMGGGKGGSDFDPKGKSDADILRFCQAFMLKLSNYIGPKQDVPAGDIGVGSREIGYLFGAYKQISGVFNGVLTGKAPGSGGSLIRKEATGYGTVYFLEAMLAHQDKELKGLTCAVSGAGNVALYTVEKLLQKEAKVITVSDSDGTLLCQSGFTSEHLEAIKTNKQVERGRLKDLADSSKDFEFKADTKPWQFNCDVAIPSATQNELNEEDAKALHENKVVYVVEAANMPLTSAATAYMVENKVVVAPSKAVNAGGVAVSGLERTQNALMQSWSSDKVDKELKKIMQDIHQACIEFGEEEEGINYIKGANLAGFIKVADAMLFQGIS
ncbi:NADP-specific glutamate dehydrogenase [Marinicella sp. S1101]|uniref:NADP-specific glutamate dehydrogenase n=1 Tax=Marinicella marina TaxID=2996016 RepID=UPI002261024E|nr:NADP-specific glutamate dehydrogenase [Marinicella marina]MCX7553823.1 NADP-specific glutamate dehydrogenase [Marinicella marina]MDJ1140899.1 NADP-specific glutamate dehydrogenase [Marinicella marina]